MLLVNTTFLIRFSSSFPLRFCAFRCFREPRLGGLGARPGVLTEKTEWSETSSGFLSEAQADFFFVFLGVWILVQEFWVALGCRLWRKGQSPMVFREG